MAALSPVNDPVTDPSVQELIAARPWLKYDAMSGLLLDDVPLAHIAQAAGTPTWVYSAATLRSRLRALTNAMTDAGMDTSIHYAVKANYSRAVLSLFAAEQAGADVVSGGELLKARRAGIAASRIVYSGVGKSVGELRLALAEDIGQINVESAEELDMLSALAEQMGRIARVALRVNPDVDAATNDKIATGRAGDKFGIPFGEAAALYAKATGMPGIQPVGLATHIGSQITSLAPFRDAYGRIADLVRELRERGLSVTTVDCGGGLGIPYRNEAVPSAAGLAAAMRQAFHNLDVRLSMEPGRWLVGPAGLLLASVILTKQTPYEPIIVLDAAMNDLVRPSMYNAWHGIVPISAIDAVAPHQPCTVVGPVCESGDTFARCRSLPPLVPNATVAILDAGAYGAVMSSTYNARPLAAEVWVDAGRWSVIRDRQPIEALWGKRKAARMNDPASLLRRLAARRFLARGVILFEAVWPAIWPAVAVVGVFFCAAMLELPALLPAWLHATVLAATALAFLALLIRGLAKVRIPNDRAADRRLETRSGLVHRPLAVLSDRPATADPVSVAIWQAHASRAVSQIGRLRVGLPRPGMARRDPRAMRYAMLLSVLTTLAIANVEAPNRLYAAVMPSLPMAPAASAAELQAWITPPGYTRLAPVFLKPDGGSASVPAGSHLTVNVSGGGIAPVLALNDRTAPFHALDQSSFQADWDLTRGGHLTVTRDGTPMAAWTVTVVDDQPPVVSWGENPGHTQAGQQTRLPWQVSDDYGVTSLQAEIHLRDRGDAPPVIVSIPLPGGSPKAAHGTSQPDLTANPWSGLPVIARLVAHDSPGQTGTSADIEFTLPERPFHNPIARLLIEARKSLSVHPDDRSAALAALDGLMQRPEAFGEDLGAFLNLSAIYYGLVRGHADSEVTEAQALIWELALHMEEGQTEQTARTLEQARQAARDALDKAQQEPNAANREELAKKLEELRQAIEDHMRALREEAQRNNDVIPFDPKAMQLSDRDMQRMAEQAEQSAKEGRMADAQQQMAQLEKMLDQLRNARTQSGDKQANGKRQRGKNQTSAVQDMIAREGGLLDHAQRRGSVPQPGDPATERQADARVQQALRRALGELMQQFTDLTGEVSPGLGEADQAMEDAQSKLNQGQDGEAGQAQQQAIAALQKGNKEMGQAMAKQFGSQPGQGEDGDEGDQDGLEGAMGMMMPDGQRGDGRSAAPLPGSPRRADSGNRDPLGRTAQGSATDSNDVEVPEERERQRTQAIQEELRRRGADQERPRQELDYIDRLLKQF